jgi:hypothetical protein
MVTRTAKKAAAPTRSTRSTNRSTKPTAKKAAAPARRTRTAPAKSAPAPEVEEERPVVSKGAQGATLPAAITVTAHDVLRAKLTYEHLYARYWEQYGEEVAEIKARGKEVLAELDGPGRVGRPPKEAPITQGKKSDPLIGETYDYNEFKGFPLVKIREIARDLAAEGIIEETVKKTVILEQMEEAGLFRESDDEAPVRRDSRDVADTPEEDEEGDEEFEDEDDDSEDDEESDEEDDDDDDEEDGDDITPDYLRRLNLKDLQDVAEENDIPWKKKTQAALLAELIEAAGGEDEEPDDEEDEDEEEDGGLTEEQIRAMSNKELRTIMAQLVKAGEDEPPLKVRKDTAALAEWVIEHLDEDEED